MSKIYKLTYFPVQALGEPIRWLLIWGNLKFEDYRINRDDWIPKLKPTMPFGKMPLLETPEGYKLHQHTSICRYLAKKINLVGKNDWEATQADIIVDTFQDLKAPLDSYFYDPDPVTRAAKLGPIQKEVVPFYIGKFEEILRNNNGLFVGSQITWADVYFAAVSDYFQKMSESDFFTNNPNLTSLRERVISNPQIRKWIKNRPADIPRVT